MGVEGAGSGGRGGGDNINYLVKMITENKVFFIFFCEIGCFCLPLMYVRYRFGLLFPLVWQFLISLPVCLSLPLSLSYETWSR